MKYQLTIFDKTATEDNYKDGEVGMGNSFYINETFKGNTIQEVIKKACDFVGGDYEGEAQCWQVDIDANEGRIDFQTLETASAEQPNDAQLKMWREGTYRLYACYYVGQIEKVTSVNLEKTTA